MIELQAKINALSPGKMLSCKTDPPEGAEKRRKEKDDDYAAALKSWEEDRARAIAQLPAGTKVVAPMPSAPLPRNGTSDRAGDTKGRKLPQRI